MAEREMLLASDLIEGAPIMYLLRNGQSLT
jgi:hypothetical protein